MINPIQVELDGLSHALEHWADKDYLKHSTFTFDKKAQRVMNSISHRLKNNYPYESPYYAGQMIKPPHPIARIAYSMALHINPNNHALDGGKESSAMERECVAEIAAMFGWENHLGHLTSGGTMANLEALWMARNFHPGKRILASKAAHYTHERICSVLGIAFDSIEHDEKFSLQLNALELELQKGDVAMVVATIGTTGAGMLDPLPEIIELGQKYGVRVHADAAYGGYFALADNLSDYGKHVYRALKHVDSLVIDPHKHGLVPYGCGCVIFNDPTLGIHYKHDSPYTYFTSQDLHLGEISLECSRAGASAISLRAMMDYWPLQPQGEFSKSISAGRDAALKFYHLCESNQNFFTLNKPELDIIVFGYVGQSATEISEFSSMIFHEAEKQGIFLALIQVPTEFVRLKIDVKENAPFTTLLRSVMMKKEHLTVCTEIFERILTIAQHLGQRP